MKENLVIVRAGDESVHRTWFGENQNWDLIVSYYGANPLTFSESICFSAPGGKLEAVHDLLVARPDLLEGRKFIALPDDDVASDCSSINSVFDMMRIYNLKIAQPSLAPDSFVNNKITASVPGLKLRYTNYVETMVPFFSVDVVNQLLPIFKGLRFGWGLDHLWSKIVRPEEIAIIDEIKVRHTRKQGTGPLYSEGVPLDEMRSTIRRFGATCLPNKIVKAAISMNGEILHSRDLRQRALDLR